MIVEEIDSITQTDWNVYIPVFTLGDGVGYGSGCGQGEGKGDGIGSYTGRGLGYGSGNGHGAQIVNTVLDHFRP